MYDMAVLVILFNSPLVRYQSPEPQEALWHSYETLLISYHNVPLKIAKDIDWGKIKTIY